MRKKTFEQVNEFVKSLNFELVSNEYLGNKTKLILKDNEGYYYYINFDKLSSGAKPEKFHINNPYTIQNIKLWCKLNNKPFELVSDQYEGSDKYLIWRCLKDNCNEIFKMTWGNIISGFGCSYCAGKKVGMSNCLAIKNPSLASEWNNELNNCTPCDVTANSGKSIWWTCKECGYVWKAVINDRNGKGNNGCPKCNQSKGEKKILKFLIDNKIVFDIQYKIDGCKYKKLLPFDFAIFDINNNLYMLIEYDGEQHFKETRYQAKKEKLEIIQKRDKIKSDFCKQHKIPLLRIPYWNFNQIEEILKNQLSSIDNLIKVS